MKIKREKKNRVTRKERKIKSKHKIKTGHREGRKEKGVKIKEKSFKDNHWLKQAKTTRK